MSRKSNIGTATTNEGGAYATRPLAPLVPSKSAVTRGPYGTGRPLPQPFQVLEVGVTGEHLLVEPAIDDAAASGDRGRGSRAPAAARWSAVPSGLRPISPKTSNSPAAVSRTASRSSSRAVSLALPDSRRTSRDAVLRCIG